MEPTFENPLVTNFDSVPPMPDYISLENFNNADGGGFNIEVIESCAHNLCDLSFGFTVTHPKYTEEEWLHPIIKRVQEYHGEAAYQFLDSFVNTVGMCGYECSPSPELTLGLLQMAAICSERHRGARMADYEITHQWEAADETEKARIEARFPEVIARRKESNARIAARQAEDRSAT